MPTAAIYVRLSSFRAGEPDVAPETQRRACRAYAESRGWQVVEYFEDLDVSGGSLNRPELTRLRKQWGRYDHVIAHKLDRWSRSLTDFLDLHQEAEDAGVSLVSVSESLDMSTPMGRFVAQILVAFAEMERAIITSRIRNGKETARDLGRWSGGKVPFGFSAEDGFLVVNDAEAGLIRETIRKRQSGVSWAQICQWLQEVAPSRQWSSRTVRRTISAERLRGTILSPAEWEAAQETVKPLKRADWTPRQDNLLSGMLRCGSCGNRMYHRTWNGEKYQKDMYLCNNARCTERARIRADLGESFFERLFLRLFGQTQERPVVHAVDQRAERMATLRQEIRKLDSQLSSLDMEQLLEAAGSKKAMLDELQDLENSPTQTVWFQETGRTLSEAWQQGGLLDRRALLRQHVMPDGAKVMFTGDGILHPNKIVVLRDNRSAEEILGV